MKIEIENYKKIEQMFSKQKSKLKISNLEVINTLLYILEKGKKLLKILVKTKKKKFLLMDKAYEGDETRELAESLNFIPVVPPKSNRKSPWKYDKILYKYRNEIERLFCRVKRFRRIFTRYDKLDIMFINFIYLVFIFVALFRANTP